jgi:hypothetical protein
MIPTKRRDYFLSFIMLHTYDILNPIAFASCRFDLYCPVASISSNFRFTSRLSVAENTVGDPSLFRNAFMASGLNSPYPGSLKKSKVMQISPFFQ